MTMRADTAGHWLGLCRKAPVLRTATVMPEEGTSRSFASQQGGSAPAPVPGSIRDGIRIATGSFRALLRERSLWWFMALAWLVMLSLFLARWWNLTRAGHSTFLISVAVPPETNLLVNPFMVFDISILLLEMVCLTGLTLVLAGLVLHRSRRGNEPVTVRESFTGINGHTGSLLGLALLLSVIAWLAYELVSQTRLLGGIAHTISMALFHLPYAYYFSNELSGAVYFAFTLMAINTVALIVALSVIPGIVLEKKRLLPALAGAHSLLMMNWRMILGCAMVFGIIVLAVAAVALTIGQSPLLLGHDHDFFLQVSRGQVLMAAVCYGFVIVCWAGIAAWISAAGIAIADSFHRYPVWETRS